MHNYVKYGIIFTYLSKNSHLKRYIFTLINLKEDINMKKEEIIVPKDKCPLDVLSEMGERTKNAWIFLHYNWKWCIFCGYMFKWNFLNFLNFHNFKMKILNFIWKFPNFKWKNSIAIGIFSFSCRKFSISIGNGVVRNIQLQKLF